MRTISASNALALLRLAERLPQGSEERRVILSTVSKSAYNEDFEDDDADSEDEREELDVDAVSDAIWIQSESARRRKLTLAEDELLDLAVRELSHYGNKKSDIEKLLAAAIKDLIKGRHLKKVSGGYQFV
jgi:hypothetical protein